jgi:SAM-dependent MidA family methyltransferase
MYDLQALIREEIKRSEHRAIPFVRFMELALYHPQGGYYTTEHPKVGKEGDFFTSASVHPVFAETLADAMVKRLREQGIQSPSLVEIGGGTGTLARNIVKRLEQAAPDLYHNLRVILIETSPYHRRLQAEALQEFKGDLHIYASLEEAAAHTRVEGVVYSNEWLDAFPVHLAEKTASGWREVWVTEREGGFGETLGDVTPELAEFLNQVDRQLPRGMRIEANLGMREAVRHVSRLLARGTVITIDYGDMEEELYHPSRKKGTLMCYHRHRADDNPYVLVGEKDITAHVNFSALMRWGEEAGLQTLSYMRQDQFLIQNGILEKAMAHNDTDPFTSQAMKRNRAIQQLIYPGGLGGMFRVLIQEKS